MLEVKKDRLKEIDKQLRKRYKNNKFSKVKYYIPTELLRSEKKTLLQEIKDIENKRGNNHGEKAL